MRWFGEDWGAPICKTTEHAATPDVLCAHGCGHEIRPGDSGLLLPYSGEVEGKGMRFSIKGAPDAQITFVNYVPHLAYHLVCFFDEIGVRGKTHV